MIIRFLITAMLFLLPLSLFGQWQLDHDDGGIKWQNVTRLMSGSVKMFAQQGNKILAAHDKYGILVSNDDGKTWQRSGMTSPTTVLATDRHTLVTIAGQIPYSSDNFGATWQSGYTDTLLGSYSKTSLAMSNNGIAALLCQYQDHTPQRKRFSRLFVSLDGCKTWRSNNRLTNGYLSIAFLDNILIAAGTKNDNSTNVQCSFDNGQSWQFCAPIAENILGLYTYKSLLVATTDNNSTFFDGVRGLYVSADSGKSWRKSNLPRNPAFTFPYPLASEEQIGRSGLPFNIVSYTTNIAAITFDKNGEIIIGFSENLFYRSSDTGRTWKLISSLLWKSRSPWITETILTTDSHILIGNTPIHRCTLDGENIEQVLAMPFQSTLDWFETCDTSSSIKMINAIGSSQPIYFLANKEGLHRSFDGLLWHPVFPKLSRWQAKNSIDPNEFVHPLLSKPYFTSLDGDYCVNSIAGNDNIILAFTKSGTVLRSTDKGTNWLTIHSASHFTTNSDVFLAEQQSIFVAVINGIIYRSDDGGMTWQNNSNINRLTSSEIIGIATNSSTIFIATRNEVLRSYDKGITWFKNATLLDASHINAIVATNSVVFAVTDKGLIRSLDNGITWEEANEGLFSKNIKAIVAINNIAILSTDQSLTYFSSDNGKKWNINYFSYNAFYSDYLPSPTKIETIKKLISNKTSLLALTQEYSIFRSELPVYLGDTFNRAVTIAPNPTKDIVSLAWQQYDNEIVTIEIYDAFGRFMDGTNNQSFPSGSHRFVWNVSSVATGIYFYRCVIGNLTYSGKIVVAR